MTNLSIESINTLPLGQLCALNAKALLSLLQEADANLKKAKRIKDWLDGALKMKYEDKAQCLRQSKGKDTGTVSFEDEGIKVTAYLPKKVSWDQEKLKAVVQRIRDKGDNPEEYVEVSYRIGERHFNAWPSPIRHCFEAARTLSTGKQTFTLQTTLEESL